MGSHRSEVLASPGCGFPPPSTLQHSWKPGPLLATWDSELGLVTSMNHAYPAPSYICFLCGSQAKAGRQGLGQLLQDHRTLLSVH